MLTHKNILISCAALVVTGCTMIPKYDRPATPVAATYPGATQTVSNLTASELSWTNFFAEERLRKLIALSLANNRDLRVAMLNVEQSRAQYRVTFSESLPSVNGSGGMTRSHSPGITSGQWNASVGTSAYEIDLFGRVRSLSRQALEKYFATEEARRGAQMTLVAEVASQYFALRQAEEQKALAERTLAAVQESYSLNKATFEAGATSELDLRTAEGQVQTAKINILNYERQKAQAENALTLLVGCALPADLPTARPFGDSNLLADVPAGLPSELVERRPDILQAEHTLKAANANVGAARAAFFPRITLTSSVGTTSSQLSELFGSGTGVWSFSPQITVPIFAGGQLRADLEAAKVGTHIEVANYEKAIQTAFREVADALAANSTYAMELTERTILIAAQERRFELATLRYRQGEDSYLNVLSAQQDFYSAQQGLLAAQYNKLTSQISLYQALGGGWK